MVDEHDERLAALFAVDEAPDASFAASVAARIKRARPTRTSQRRGAMLLVVSAVGAVSLIGASAAHEVIVAMTPPGRGAYPPLTAWVPMAMLAGFMGPLVHALITRICAR